MIKDLANTLKNTLQPYKDSGIISDLHGLVRTLEYKPEGTDKIKKIPFPVDYIEPIDCQECESLFICVPDKTKPCLVYFEGTEASTLQSLESATKYKATLSLICWYNLQYFGIDSFLQSKLIALFTASIKLAKLESTLSLPIDFNLPTLTKVIENDTSIFNKYTYEESRSQFVGYNYSCFKIELQINYSLNENSNCINPIVVIPNPVIC